MKYIDMHCDTLTYAFYQKRKDLLHLPGAMADIERMRKSEVMAQFFAICMPQQEEIEKLGERYVSDDAYIRELYEILMRAVEEHEDVLSLTHDVQELRKNDGEGKLSAFLTLEDGRAVDGSMEKLEKYFQMGFRLISLTWNYENCFGYPNSGDAAVMNVGLKDFGKQAVERMNELGMLVDVSHLSDGGFKDVAMISRKPFVASHSNCRALSPHPRNLTDDMIRILGEKGGVAGLNFAPSFLNADINSKDSRIVLMVEHIRHLVDKGGIDCVAIGTDFDGIEGKLEIGGPEKMPLLFDALQRKGFHESDIEKIAFQNVNRVLTEAL